jgi:hypothetical protein
VQPQLTGQHQAGRAAADDDHLNHGPSSSSRLHVSRPVQCETFLDRQDF